MCEVELLTIEDRFEIPGIGVIVEPDFSVPDGRWVVREESMVVVRPDSSALDATARLMDTHYNIPDPYVSMDRRWRITICILGRGEDELPVGSKLLVAREVRDMLITKSKT